MNGYKCYQLQTPKRRIWLWIIFNLICHRSLLWQWSIQERLLLEKIWEIICCHTAKEMRPFPYEERNVQKRVTKSFKIPLYCICRLPDNREKKMGKCTECKEWFHKSCIAIPKKVFEEVISKWYCTKFFLKIHFISMSLIIDSFPFIRSKLKYNLFHCSQEQ